MRRTVLLFALVLIAACNGFAQKQEAKTTLSPDPLTAEQVAVYRAFLQGYDNGSGSTLNLAQVTATLGFASFELKPGEGCLKGMALENLKQAQNTTHRLDQLATISDRIRIVDPEKQNAKVRENDPGTALQKGSKSVEDAVKEAFASGLLTLSEIAFDKSHEWAVMSFSFYCGALCGHGAVMILHKTEGTWKVTDKDCGSWIS